MLLTVPDAGQAAAEAFVVAHLAHLICDDVAGSGSIRGGQRAADTALERFDVTGYAGRRNEVLPPSRRGASGLSPYIRHGLLQLGEVWQAITGGPPRDVQKFRDELLWQEFARHWYARLGEGTAVGTRRELTNQSPMASAEWDRSMRCVDMVVSELEADGWLVNQTRMWLASQWAIRDGHDWQAGEDLFFQHLIDGSRAANRLGWQWTTGVGSSKHYGFSQWQVNKRAPGLCDGCDHQAACPIADWPEDPEFVAIPKTLQKQSDDPTLITGPHRAVVAGAVEAVWLTAESLGVSDPALQAHPALPVVFVFDEPLLARLQLSSKRLVFLVETLAELAQDRQVELLLGDPAELLPGRHLAVTFAPVPGFRRRASIVEPSATYPWPWLHRPSNGSIASFSAWRKSVL